MPSNSETKTTTSQTDPEKSKKKRRDKIPLVASRSGSGAKVQGWSQGRAAGSLCSGLCKAKAATPQLLTKAKDVVTSGL